MEDILITYLLKASIILSIFYLVYHFLLKIDTFFTINRHFFILGILVSLFLPFLEFTTITYVENSNFSVTETNSLIPVADSVTITDDISEKSISITDQFNWWQIGFVIYSIGTLIFLIRFGVQLLSLRKLLSQKVNLNDKSFNLIEVEEDVAPFSFFKTIVYNPTLHSGKELDMILIHEKVHVKQYHTIDLLISNVIVIFQWFNPFAWLYKKSLEQNLEFIADQEAINEISSLKEYQLALLHVSSNNYTAITNNFYQSLIKKRIIMLNKQPSKKKSLIKFAIILPLLSLFLWSFNTKKVIQYKDNGNVNVSNGELKIEIKKENTRDELEKIKKSLKEKHNIKLSFKTLEFKDNLISKINISIENESGYMTSYSDADSDESIPNILIILSFDKDKNVKDAEFVITQMPQVALQGSNL